MLLSLISITVFAFESNQDQFPQIEFRSTSNCQTVTGYNPHITDVGATTIYDSQPNLHNRPYKVGERPQDPYPTPVGDISFISMLLFAGAYTLYKRNKS